jgi:hypothetical protein
MWWYRYDLRDKIRKISSETIISDLQLVAGQYRAERHRGGAVTRLRGCSLLHGRGTIIPQNNR